MALHVSTIRRWSTLVPALVLVSATLAACGGSSNDTSSSSDSSSGSASTQSSSGDGYGGSSGSRPSAAAASKLGVDAVERGGDDLSFSPRKLTASAGTVTLTLQNGTTDKLPHGIAIEGNGVDKDGRVVQPGDSSTVTVKLKPGTYTFYCPVGEHEKYGMKGTLTVQ